MLKLTKKADYGLMALKYLAEHPETPALSAKDVADAYGIPAQLLAKILQRLTKTGLLRSHAGMNGGYALARDARQISAFEVIHDPKVVNPEGAKFVVATTVAAEALPVLGGKGKVTPLLDVPHTGSRAVFLGKLEVEPGAEVPRNTHPGADEILFVATGAGELTVGSEKFPFEAPVALYIPAGQPHAAKFTGTDKAQLVQIFAPAGPEDRYKDSAKSKP